MFQKYFPHVILFFSSFALTKSLLLPYFPDFSSYYYGPLVVFEGGNPYVGGGGFHTPYVYPPMVLLFFLPFTKLDFVTAQKLWVFLSIGFYYLSMYILLKVCSENLFTIRNSVLISFVTLTFFPLKWSLGLGQINIFILLLVIFCLYYLKKNQTNWSGFFLGLSVGLKFFPILFLPYFLLLRKYRLVSIALGILIGLNIFTYLFIPSDIIFYFIEEIFPTLISGWKDYYYNQALSGLLARFLPENELFNFLRPILSATLILCVFAMIVYKEFSKLMYFPNFSFLIRYYKSKLNPKTEILTDLQSITNKSQDVVKKIPLKQSYKNFQKGLLEMNLIISVSLITNTFSWQHHYVWILIPLISTFYYVYQFKLNKIYYVLLFVCYFLIAFNLKNPLSYPTVVQSHVLIGTIVLLLLDGYLLLKNSNENKLQ